MLNVEEKLRDSVSVLPENLKMEKFIYGHVHLAVVLVEECALCDR